MQNYVIDEVIEILCDVDKILTVKFRLNEDETTTHREIIDSEYYSWCEENHYINGEVEEDLEEDFDDDTEEELDYNGFHFDIEIWESNYSDVNIIIDYIYDNYHNKLDLPETKDSLFH